MSELISPDIILNHRATLPRRKDWRIGCLGAGFIMRDCHLVAYRQAGFNPVAITLYPLAQLGRARAAARAGDAAESRKAYEALFVLWKDADSDVPVLREARGEYRRLMQPPAR